MYSVYATEYTSYTSMLYGFMIDYPSNWLVEEYPYYSHTKVSFTSNPDEMNDNYSELMLIGVEELQKKLTIEEYGELIIKQHSRSLHNLTIINHDDFMLANNDGKIIQYKGVDAGVNIRGEIVYAIINNTAYTIINAVEEYKYEKYKQVFEHMVNSFIIDKSMIPRPISDKYVNDEMELTLPQGWQGLISNIQNDTIIRIMPNIKSNTIMEIIITDINSIKFFNDQINDMLNECDVRTINFININGGNGLEIEQTCNERISKEFLFIANDKLMVFTLISDHKEYATYIGALEDSIKNSKINNLSNINQYLDERLKGLPERIYHVSDINIPKDWNIFKKDMDKINIIYITPNGSRITKNYTSISIIEYDLDPDSVLVANGLNYECKINTVHYILYREHTIGYQIFCNNEMQIHLDVIKPRINDKIFTISYLTTFEGIKYEDEFNNILESLNVDPTLLFSLNVLSSIITDEYKVVINSTEYSIKYGYLSNIEELKFNETTKELIFKVTADNQTMLRIEQTLMEGPYTIIINDHIMNIDANNKDIFVFVDVNDSVIKIVGSKVIPEFSIPILLISLLICITIIIRKYGNSYG